MINIARRLGIRVVPLTRRQRFALQLAAAAGTLLLLWLDSPGSPFALDTSTACRTAAIVNAIVTGIEILAGWVATAAEVTAAYVWIALQWLGAATATLLKNTGAMFAKVWDGVKVVWSDVLKPALVWVDDHLKRVYAWLKDSFKPVFDFLRDVRARLHAFYATFVRPVVDTIEFMRQINRVLLALHIDVLAGLDRALQQIEQRIEEPFLWLEKKLNEVWNALELVVTLDGFFQRLTLLSSMQRYAPSWLRISTNARMTTLSDTEAYKISVSTQPQDAGDLIVQTNAWWDGQPSDTGDALDAIVQRSRDFFTAA